MKTVSRRLLSICLVIAMLVTLVPSVFAATTDGIGLATGDYLIKNTVTRLAPGVVEYEVVTNTAAGNDQKIDYLCEVDLSGTASTKIVAGYGNYSADTWNLVPTTTQAAAYEASHPGETVVAAINADFFNMATGEPQGALVMDGEVKHAVNGRNYFAILKDGSAVIRDSSVSLDDVQAAVGGDMIIVKDGKITNIGNSEYATIDYSRTAIGVKADGTVVTFVTHGRLYPVSCGRTYHEIAEMLLNAGCVTAMMLDCGGSSTYCGRPEGTDKLEVRNSPSDGAERSVSSTILIVSTAESTGEFDHAVLAPNNELYTPGFEVQFTASGADSSGATVELPENVTWALAEDSKSMGTIDADTGVFLAGNTTGEVTVQLCSGTEVVGTTTIEIAEPDQIYFSAEEVSLGFEEETDFGIVVRNQGRDINYKVGDLKWTITDEKMGTFDGNIFTSSDGESLNGNVTVTSAYSDAVTATIHVIVGMLPTIVWDFEDVVDEETGDVIAAKDYYAGILSTSNYNRGGKQSVEIVSIDDDEPVRFGSHALKLNYDFTQCGAVTEGACIGTTDSLTVPGSPTGIGVWVYAPEGVGVTYEGSGTQAGFWLRGYVRDGAGNNMPYDFTLEPKACVDADGNWNEVQPGIYWEGWMYCEADLTSMTGPFSIQPGMTFRLMYVAGTLMGTKTAGAIYFDNLQFVYGTNVDDIDSPVVDSITANNATLSDGDVINTNTVTFDGLFHDVENKYTSGIDTSTIRMYVDGINVVDNDDFTYVADPDGTRNHVYDVYLTDGEHSVTVSLRDNFGNETSKTVFFTVKGESQNTVPTVTVTPKETSAVLGQDLNLEIRASEAGAVSESTTTLKFDNQFTDYTVTFADGFEGTTSYSKLSDTLTITATRKETAVMALAADELIATVSIAVPNTLTESAEFSYSVKAGSYRTEAGQFTYSGKEQSVGVEAYYQLDVAPVIVGQSAVVNVTTNDGTKAEGVTVYLDNGTKLGETGEDGTLTTDRFSGATGSNVIYAKDQNGNVSFRYTVKTYTAKGEADGTPFETLLNAAVDNSTQQNITWFSNPLAEEKQSIQYAVSGSDDWKTVEATSTLVTFTADYAAAYSNSVTLTGLTPGTTYDFKVGCGDVWSEVDTFKTIAKNAGVSFFLMGDIQTDDLTNVDALMAQIKEKNYDFGIQTGDFVDDAVRYSYWKETAAMFSTSRIGNASMIHVLGNHEYAGDATAERATTIFNLPTTAAAGSYYSVTYGNVYAAVINFTGNANQLKTALEWLKTDCAASDAVWKVLLIHQPSYYTNIVGGNAEIHALVPPVVDELGIDFVFSGHDHSYARTEPLTDGEVDETDGAVYFICGSAGEKSYTVTDNEEFHFAKLSDDFTGLYLEAVTDEYSFTVNTYEVDGSLVDTYTMYNAAGICHNEGSHVVTDDAAIYNPETGKIVCERCETEMDPAELKYTGFATDVNGVDTAGDSQYYFYLGTLKTGWFSYGLEYMYANNAGLIDHGVMTYSTETCTANGTMMAYSPRYNLRYTIGTAKYTGHQYVKQDDGTFVCTKSHYVTTDDGCKEVVCGHTAIDIANWNYSLAFNSATYGGSAKTPAITVKNPATGETLNYATDGMGTLTDYYRIWANNKNVGVGTVTIEANPYGDYYNSNGPVVLELRINPKAPTGLTATTVSSTAIDLKWKAVTAGITEGTTVAYKVYVNKNGKWSLLGTTADTNYSVTGLVNNTEYSFAVKAVATVPYGDATTALTSGYSDAASGKTSEGKALEGTVKLSFTMSDYNGYVKKPVPTVTTPDGTVLTKGTDYTVSYSNNVDVGYATVTITGTGAYEGELKATFQICPDLAKNVAVNRTSGTTATITWTAAKCSDPIYQIYQSSDNGATWKLVATVTDANKCDITGLKSNMTYQYKIRTKVTKDDVSFWSRSYTTPVTCELAHEHTVVVKNAKEATCTEAGYTGDKVCSVCGETIETGSTIPAKGHTEVLKNAKEATCTEAGYTGDKVCSVCGETIEAGSVIPAKGHTEELKNAKEATCTEAGYTGDKVCSVCGKTVETGSVIPAKGHTEELKNAKEATCTEAGYTGDKVCSACGETIETGSVIPAKGHTEELKNAKEATCTEAGYTGDKVCSVCGETIETGSVIPAKGHVTEGEDYKAPTCTEDGYSGTGVCTVCGETVTEGYVIPATGHVVVVKNAKEATCTEDGHTGDKVCSVCGETIETGSVIPAKGHDYQDEVVEPTCTEKGYTKHTCKTCGESHKDTYVDPVGHSWDEGVVVKNATSTTEGKKVYTCETCGKTRNEVIPVLTNPFTDLVKNSTYYEPVLWAVDRGITTGKTTTTFAPKEECTRAQIVTLLWRYAGSPEPTTTETEFTDLVEDSTYYKAVLWAVENGITNGTSATEFSPKETCTRAQIVTLLWRYEGRPEPTSMDHNFTDLVEDSTYYKAVLWAVEKGITTGTSATTFEPKEVCTRARAVTFLYRLMVLNNQ